MTKRNGFTIVELLIVIVVIAVLASITVTAYSGISKRAAASAQGVMVAQWAKRIKVKTAEGATFGPGVSCLGTSSADYPAISGFNAGECWRSGYTDTSGYVYNSTTTYNLSILGALLNGSDTFKGDYPVTVQTETGGSYTQTDTARGAIVKFDSVPNSNPISQTAFVSWVPIIKGQCGAGKVAQYSQYCQLRIDLQ